MSSATVTQQVVVVGAGVTGMLIAVDCALAGHRVTVLDRGAIPNPESSSFDQHRAIRTFVPDDPAATRRMVTAHHRWLELEELLGSKFYRRVGVVTAWPRARIDEMTDAATALGLTVETVLPAELPQLGFPADSVGMLEAAAGVLLAERVLRAAAGWLARHPAVTLRPGCDVMDVDDESGRVVLTGGEIIDTDITLIATGPWAGELLDLPVILHRQTMVYLRPPENLLRWWKNAPAAGQLGTDGRAWLLPPGGGTLLKISSDTVCRDVDRVASDEAATCWADQVLNASVLSDVDRYTVVMVKHCHYLTYPDNSGALLTRVGTAAWSAVAGGGTGFSAAPLVANQIVRAMAKEAA